MWGVTQSFTLANNPRGNAVTERNRTALGVLRVTDLTDDRWDVHLRELETVFNNTPHNSTGLAPIEAATGRPATWPALAPSWIPILSQQQFSDHRDKLRRLPASTRGLSSEELDSLLRSADEELLERAQYIRELVVQNQAEKRRKTHLIANRRRSPEQDLKVGDQVLRLNYRRERGVKGKLQRPYTAGYTVHGFSGPTGVVLMDRAGQVLASPVPRDQLYREARTCNTEGVGRAISQRPCNLKERPPVSSIQKPDEDGEKTGQESQHKQDHEGTAQGNEHEKEVMADTEGCATDEPVNAEVKAPSKTDLVQGHPHDEAQNTLFRPHAADSPPIPHCGIGNVRPRRVSKPPDRFNPRPSSFKERR